MTEILSGKASLLVGCWKSVSFVYMDDDIGRYVTADLSIPQRISTAKPLSPESSVKKSWIGALYKEFLVS